MYDNSRMRREIGQYLERMRQSGMSERYVSATKCYLIRFCRHCQNQGIYSAKAVTTDSITSFLAPMENFSASHQVQLRCYIRKFLADMNNPAMLRLKTKVHGSARTRVDWLTPEETQRIFQYPMSPRTSVLIGAGLLQGMRRVETLRLSVKDARTGLRMGVLRVRGKDWKEREIPLHQEFHRILENYLKQLEGASDGDPLLSIQRTRSERDLKEFCQAFGRKFTFHTMRRTFGRNLWLLGVPIETISELLGHNSTDMTRRYLGLNLSDMREALARYTIARECTSISSPGKTRARRDSGPVR